MATAFWSAILPAKGKPVEQQLESTEHVLSSIHITGLALGANPAKGAHVVRLTYNGTKPVLATLEAPHTRQWQLDIALDQTFSMENLGDSDVHVYGFQASTPVAISDDEDEEEEDEDEDFDGDEGEEDEDEDGVPQGLPLKRLKGRLQPASDTDEDEEGEEGEDEDEGEDEGEDEDDDDLPNIDELGSDDMIAEAASDDDEDEEGAEGESDEEMVEPSPPPKVGGKRGAAQTPQPAKAQKQVKAEPPKSAPPKQAAQARGGSRAIPITTPAGAGPKAVPVKGAEGAKGKGQEAAKGKGKGKEEQAKTPQPAQPQAAAKGVATPSNEAEFRSELTTFLRRQGGAVPINTLGNAIKKPASVPVKLKQYLENHKELFAVDSKGNVSLKKK